MSHDTTEIDDRSAERPPWSTAAALLAASLAVLIGVWQGSAPETIAARSLTGGVVIGLVVAALIRVGEFLKSESE